MIFNNSYSLFVPHVVWSHSSWEIIFKWWAIQFNDSDGATCQLASKLLNLNPIPHYRPMTIAWEILSQVFLLPRMETIKTSILPFLNTPAAPGGFIFILHQNPMMIQTHIQHVIQFSLGEIIFVYSHLGYTRKLCVNERKIHVDN